MPRPSLPWKVHNGTAQVAAFAHPEDAARFLSGSEPGANVRYNERIVYVVGPDGDPADSFDEAAGTMLARADAQAAARAANREARTLAQAARAPVVAPEPSPAP